MAHTALPRREFLAMSAAASAAPSLGPSRLPERPNVLLFLTDDHGHWAMAPSGNSELHTPNLDFLADSGARMANAFTPCPVCSPARASLWTGRLPSQHGIHDWIREEGDSRTWLGEEVPLARLFARAGYQTALFGKWHCGQREVAQAGFATWMTHETHQYPHRGSPRFLENGKPVAFLGQQSALVTSRAQQFLRNRERDAPFFLCVGYVDTHAPFKEHPERIVRRYRRAAFRDVPREEYKGPLRPLHVPSRNPAERAEALAQYYAAVTYIDEQVGILLDELEGTGDLDRTLVVYTSDHGHMNGHHGLMTKGNATVPQNFLEESIRVPLLLRLPGMVATSRAHSAFVDHCDLFHTLLEAAGIREDEEEARRRNSPGRSFLPMLRGEDAAWRREQFCEYGNARMVRTEKHKLVLRYPAYGRSDPDELYDMEADPSETVNLLPRLAGTGLERELRSRLEAHFQRYEVPARSGRRIEEQPSYNPNEPWRSRLGL